ncbi:Hypothetical protein CINCED_3A005283 [Cinara cedri]|uniref:Uncharacterized protein n=1 Tax=Cinara cedri TaxID=506608 RepID=A0A5E4M170_9HEMI|nr:Hypothetical protein CINCED_3A005283 [Cinara cedri]
MHRLLIITFPHWIQLIAYGALATAASCLLLDGLFDKPVNESTNVIRNIDNQSNRTKRSMISDTQYRDVGYTNDFPNSYGKNCFSTYDQDYYIIAKSAFVVLMSIACFGLFVIIVIAYKKFCTCKRNCNSKCRQCNFIEDNENDCFSLNNP